ncbi:unnamed protein product [Penicillium bialowiezense]
MASAFDSKIELDQATAQAVPSPANGSHRLARVAGSQAFFKEELPHFSSPPGHLFGSDDISEESSEGSCTGENPIRVDPTTGLTHFGELIEEAECALGLLRLVSSGSVEESAHRPTFSRSDFVGDPASSFEDSQNAACAFLR